MAERRPDRRIGRTRRRLKQALLELIEERPLDSISIHDLTERAEVGRSTFYSHFDSKEDLLLDGFDRWLTSLAERAPADGPRTGFRFSRPFLAHIGSQARFFRATMVGGGNARVRTTVTAWLVDLIRRELRRERSRIRPRRASRGELQTELLAQALAGAFMALAACWLRQPKPVRAEVVDAVFQDLARGAVGSN